MTSPNEEKIAEELSEFMLKLSKQKDKTKLSREAGQLISRMTPEGIAMAEKRLYQSPRKPAGALPTNCWFTLFI